MSPRDRLRPGREGALAAHVGERTLKRFAQDPHIIRKSFVGPAPYLLGAAAAAAWFSAHAGFVVYLLTPLFFTSPQITPPALSRSRSSAPSDSQSL